MSDAVLQMASDQVVRAASDAALRPAIASFFDPATFTVLPGFPDAAPVAGLAGGVLIGLPLGALIIARLTGGLEATFAPPLQIAVVAGVIVGIGIGPGSAVAAPAAMGCPG